MRGQGGSSFCGPSALPFNDSILQFPHHMPSKTGQERHYFSCGLFFLAIPQRKQTADTLTTCVCPNELALAESWQRLGPDGLPEPKYQGHVQKSTPKAIQRERGMILRENPSAGKTSAQPPRCASLSSFLSLLVGANPKIVAALEAQWVM